MITLAAIIKQFEGALRESSRGSQSALLPSHDKALKALQRCRSDEAPLMLAACTGCDKSRYVPHSCGHRSCPHCQQHESQRWIERQQQKRVAAEYFMLTFTLPAELRPLAWRHQRTVYSALLSCAWKTVQSFSQNDKALLGTPGATAVLHTHSRRLDFHPHVHLVMPAAAVNKAQRLWRCKTVSKGKQAWLFSHKALAKVFRAKMLDELSRAGLYLPLRYPEEWVVDCKHVGAGDKAIVYLGRYLYRGVIAEKDIIAWKNNRLTFRYQDSKSKQTQYRSLSGVQFLRLILQHVLPRGFRRARNYGFLHPNSKQLILLLQYLGKLKPNQALPLIKKRATLICRCCGAPMKIIATKIRRFEIQPSTLLQTLRPT